MKSNSSVFLIVVAIAIILSSPLFGQQQLFTFLPDGAEEELNEQQRNFLREVRSWEGTMNVRHISVNMEALSGDACLVTYQGEEYLVGRKNAEGPENHLHRSWTGLVQRTQTDVHISKKGLHVVGLLEFGNGAILIRPIGQGRHVLVDWDLTIDEGCQAVEVNRPPKQEPLPELINEDQTHRQQKVDSRVATTSLTGECNVRVLVAYTTAAAAAVPDILLDINNLINIANTGYLNSSNTGGNISMSIELAAAFEVAYTESGVLQTDLDRLTATTDGFMDIVHNYRNLWDADQCALIVSGGGGIAWISTADGDQFSVTGVNNFGVFTFHHELGHNAACTHAINQSTQPGSSPYAGFGDPSGCYRTVMAYQDACGTGPGTCPRQNIFSDNDANTWNCGSTNYTPGTSDNRNQDRLHLSGPILIDHRTVLANAIYGSNYDWLAGESIHFAASDSVAYEASLSTFQFELHAGSEGSFRAAYQVHLGRGFKAHAGSSFRAWIDRGCTPFEETAGFEINEEGGQSRADQIQKSRMEEKENSMIVYPNPASDQFEVGLYVTYPQVISMSLIDQRGIVMKQLVIDAEIPPGETTVPVQAINLQPGQYTLVVNGSTGLMMSEKVVIVR